MKQLLIIIFTLTVTPAWADSADSSHDLAEITQTIVDFVEHEAAAVSPSHVQIEITPGKLDHRLRLPTCSEQLDTYIKNGRIRGSRITVGVDCNSDTPWTVYLPVSIKRYTEVFVANNAIPRGTRIRAEHLGRMRKDLAALRRGYYTDPQDIIGMTAKRTIYSGNPIHPNHLEKPSAIKKGEKVVISAALSGVNIRMSGEAMGKGALGDLILVRNLSSNKVIEATIVRPGVVRVRM